MFKDYFGFPGRDISIRKKVRCHTTFEHPVFLKYLTNKFVSLTKTLTKHSRYRVAIEHSKCILDKCNSFCVDFFLKMSVFIEADCDPVCLPRHVAKLELCNWKAPESDTLYKYSRRILLILTKRDI